MLWGLFLGAGSVVIYSAYAALDHASDPAVTARPAVPSVSQEACRAWRS